MKKWLVVCFFGLWLPVSFAHNCAVVDDAGNTIKLVHPAARIISLAPDLTEMLFAIDAGQLIVGTMRGSDYPLAAKKIPVIASFNSVDAEKILVLRPDLIVAWGEGRIAEPLKKLGIPIYLSHQKKLTDIPKTLRRLGCLVGKEKTAEQQAAGFMRRYDALLKANARKKVVTVFYQVWQQPLITVTKNSWIDDVITVCGGKNLFGDLMGASPTVNLEEVVVRDPDVIIGTKSGRDWRGFWQRWPGMKAVKMGNVVGVTADYVERASPRVLMGVGEVCGVLDRVRGDQGR